MQWKGPGLHGGRLLERNSMCKLPKKNHPAYARTCAIYQKEKEIIEVKHKRGVFFLEARKIVGSYMGESSYASVARRADRTNDDTKYRILVEKLTKLEANDKVSGAPEKTTLGWTLPSSSSATSCKWGRDPML